MPKAKTVNPTGQRIQAWSYSRWSTYTECPRKAYYKFIEKLPDPPSPAAERGTRLHKNAEDYVSCRTRTLDPEWKLHKTFLAKIRKISDGVACELELALTKAWAATSWFAKDAWCRIKVDLAYYDGEDSLCIEDYKTGKKYDDHEKQLSLYALGGFILAPEALHITTRNRYVDIPAETGGVVEHGFARRELPVLQRDWEKKTKAMLRDTRFAPNPTRKCLWCPFSKEKGGPCEY